MPSYKFNINTEENWSNFNNAHRFKTKQNKNKYKKHNLPISLAGRKKDSHENPPEDKTCNWTHSTRHQACMDFNTVEVSQLFLCRTDRYQWHDTDIRKSNVDCRMHYRGHCIIWRSNTHRICSLGYRSSRGSAQPGLHWDPWPGWTFSCGARRQHGRACCIIGSTTPWLRGWLTPPGSGLLHRTFPSLCVQLRPCSEGQQKEQNSLVILSYRKQSQLSMEVNSFAAPFILFAALSLQSPHSPQLPTPPPEMCVTNAGLLPAASHSVNHTSPSAFPPVHHRLLSHNILNISLCRRKESQDTMLGFWGHWQLWGVWLTWTRPWSGRDT